MKRHTLFIAIALLMSLILATSAFAVIRCVGNPRPAGCLYYTIQDAVNASNPGDIIVANPGVYYENVVISGKNNLTIQGGRTKLLYGKLTITAVKPDEVVVDARPQFETCSGPAFLIDYANNITISTLTTRHACEGMDYFKYGEGNGYSANIYSTGDFTKIDKVYSLSAEGSGIDIENMGNSTAPLANGYCLSAPGSAIVQGSLIAGNQGHSALSINSNNAVVATNTIINNAGNIFVEGCKPTISQNLITQNARNVYNDEPIYTCVHVCSGSDYAMVNANTIYECGRIGIDVHSSDYIQITNNKVTGIGGYLNLYNYYGDAPGIGINVSSSYYPVVSNNTVAETFSVGILLDYDIWFATVNANTLTAPGFAGIVIGNMMGFLPSIGPEGTFTKGKPLSKNFGANGYSYNNTVSNNKIDLPIWVGIAGEGAGLQVKGNAVTNAGYFYLNFDEPNGFPFYGAGMPFGGYFIQGYDYIPPVEGGLGATPTVHTVVDRNTITNSGWNGFYIQGFNCEITNNTAERITNDGFYINTEGGNVKTNTARYCGSMTFAPAIEEQGPNYQQAPGINFGSNGFEIVSCDTNYTGNLAELNAGRGFYLSWINCNLNSFTGNTARKNFRTGVRLEVLSSPAKLLFTNNIITDNHGEGIANFAPSIGDGTEVYILTNTALRNRTDICNEGTASFSGNVCSLADPGCNYDQPLCDLENPFMVFP
jgi:parallel beta-helix repeat protein